MSGAQLTYTGGRIFDGQTLHDGKAARFEDGKFAGLIAPSDIPKTGREVDLGGDILSPGYVDLQVNGGGGVMFNDDPSVETLARIARAHRPLGVTKLLPTLITDSPEKTRTAIAAAQAAITHKIQGVAGLHLEGPHLSIARKGAHDAQFIRPMEGEDLQALLDAKAKLPVLKVTIAPENVSLEQVETLAQAGVSISLGHSDADFETCLNYAQAGARCVTHLFNAMSQLGNREPGLVGAALASGSLSAGLIADGVHVHPATMRAAWRSKSGPGRIHLVSDAMAVAGTDLDSFRLEGREITRKDGQLRLSDGTLAGADLDLTRAVSVLVHQVGLDLEEVLRAATTGPASISGMEAHHLRESVTPITDMIRISGDLTRVAMAEDLS